MALQACPVEIVSRPYVPASSIASGLSRDAQLCRSTPRYVELRRGPHRRALLVSRPEQWNDLPDEELVMVMLQPLIAYRITNDEGEVASVSRLYAHACQ